MSRTVEAHKPLRPPLGWLLPELGNKRSAVVVELRATRRAHEARLHERFHTEQLLLSREHLLRRSTTQVDLGCRLVDVIARPFSPLPSGGAPHPSRSSIPGIEECSKSSSPARSGEQPSRPSETHQMALSTTPLYGEVPGGANSISILLFITETPNGSPAHSVPPLTQKQPLRPSPYQLSERSWPYLLYVQPEASWWPPARRTFLRKPYTFHHLKALYTATGMERFAARETHQRVARAQVQASEWLGGALVRCPQHVSRHPIRLRASAQISSSSAREGRPFCLAVFLFSGRVHHWAFPRKW